MGEGPNLTQVSTLTAAFLVGAACTLMISSGGNSTNTRGEKNYVTFSRDQHRDADVSRSSHVSQKTPRFVPKTAAEVEVAAAMERKKIPSQAADSTKTKSKSKYGFYLHVYKPAAAVLYQVQEIKKHFPGSPIYIMSDGGDRFDGLCQQEGCTFKLCPPANDRWHPWPFLNRFYKAALALDAEYIIMLEPDNTIHRPIRHAPTHDAGGLYDENPHFGEELVAHAEAIAQKSKPSYKWKYRGSGLAGGAYFRRAAILDAFADDVIAKIDWDFYMRHDSKRVFSSDFAMPIALAERGYSYAPWLDVRQVEPTEDRMTHQPKEAAFQHYGRGVAGGKPTYNMRLKTWQEEALIAEPLSMHMYWNSNCQLCYNLTAYKLMWGSDDCTNPNPYKYAPGVMKDVFWQKPLPSHPFYPANK